MFITIGKDLKCVFYFLTNKKNKIYKFLIHNQILVGERLWKEKINFVMIPFTEL